MPETPLFKLLTETIAGYERQQAQKVAELEGRIAQLEKEKVELQAELEHSEQAVFDVTDETLQNRLSLLGNSPLDTLMREASVLLEERLRHFATGQPDSLHGVQLVEAVLAPEFGSLQLSSHRGEQDGIRMLFRGAMQFVRNPPMHRLIEYEEGTAQVLLRLVDSLLQILSEHVPPADAVVTVADVRHMLRRRSIPNGQIEFYRALGNAGKEILTSNELARLTGRSRPQLAGLLGALGLRVNGTEGLRDKGGITAILKVKKMKGGWQYQMRPVLREALEVEGILSEDVPTKDVTVEDVRSMLSRRQIPDSQVALYRSLGNAENNVRKSSELAIATGCSSSQFSGVLGALGLRINGTEELRGKGGINCVLRIKKLKDGWRYQMRSVLRQALEAEGIL